MIVFEISYELRGHASPARYRRIADAIKAMTGDWAHQPESLWYIYGPETWTIGQVRQHLLPYILPGDRLTVSIPRSIAWYGVAPEVQDWLVNRMEPVGLFEAILAALPPNPPIPTPALGLNEVLPFLSLE